MSWEITLLNEIVQSCGKGYETDSGNQIGLNYPPFSYSIILYMYSLTLALQTGFKSVSNRFRAVV